MVLCLSPLLPSSLRHPVAAPSHSPYVQRPAPVSRAALRHTVKARVINNQRTASPRVNILTTNPPGALPTMSVHPRRFGLMEVAADRSLPLIRDRTVRAIVVDTQQACPLRFVLLLCGCAELVWVIFDLDQQHSCNKPKLRQCVCSAATVVFSSIPLEWTPRLRDCTYTEHAHILRFVHLTSWIHLASHELRSCSHSR